MTEDYLNGLIVVPLDGDHSILRSSVLVAEHPWRDLYREREPPPHRTSMRPFTRAPPWHYIHENQLHGPHAVDDYPSSRRSTRPVYSYKDGEKMKEVEPRETIRLWDVEEFRNSTAVKALASTNSDDIDEISAGLTRLSTSSLTTRPVIYRYIDVIKNSFALLEAIHFELFMPDRPDLRFLAIPFSTVPSGTIEGDYFRIPEAYLLSKPSFAIHLGKVEYPVVWQAKQPEYMKFSWPTQQNGLSYIVKRNGDPRSDEVEAIRGIADRSLPVSNSLFPDEDSRREHSIVRVTTRDRATAHLYPVEPTPKPPPSPVCTPRRRGSDSGETEPPFDPRSEYLKRVAGVCTSAQRDGLAVCEVHALDATEAERIEDRLGAFTSYGQKGDLELMDELFRLGSRYRVQASRGVDSNDFGEMKIDESVILKTICDKDQIGNLDECRPLLDCIYGRQGKVYDIYDGLDQEESELWSLCSDGVEMRLNERQSRAVDLYAANGPRVFCILSPPGSGKTTVAAAMAGLLAKGTPRYTGGVQLLLSVQNVAVDNMGAALKKMGCFSDEVYNMKSTKKLDMHNRAPYDYFDILTEDQLMRWKLDQMPMQEEVTIERSWKRGCHTKVVTFANKEERLNFHKREREKSLSPKILLSTVEMVLQKMYTPSKLCENLGRVTRVIIDEASLLTEAALFAIIRRFSQARIVLIGDDKQLPPFMYDNKILGQELAGRPALTVAMKTGRVPVVELNEVYRAPPTLIAPYNRLAYGGRLVSKMGEGWTPLSEIGLIHRGLPQLLMIDVDGREERNEKTMSLYNEKELEVVKRLLDEFPPEWEDDVMIICLYKEQKKRLQEILDDEYTVLTVDSAQGKEASIVILLTTRTQRATDFFCSPERCNVAVSRQQKALIILGKASLLTTNKPWSTVVNGDDFTSIKAEEM